ncbi:MAG: PilZ domain-containing protein [Planctomycetota bacterium]|nr:MAG: PilZ domain-containing protein [Planctomycetota bacterium]
MQRPYETERREFARVNVDVPVRYKFLSREHPVPDEIFEGRCANLSGGGLLLLGRVPDEGLLAPLLTHRVLVGVVLQLPTLAEPIKALCRVGWIESHPGRERVPLGLTFREITREHQDAIFRYVIRAHLP